MKIFFRWFFPAVLAVAIPALAVNLPLRIPFQGKLINPTGNNPKNGDIVMTFRIYDVPTGGSALYTEPMTVAVNNGVFAVQIGTSALLNTDLFSHASAYLGITVSGDSEMLPRQPLTMSAYAFTAMQLAGPAGIRINAGITYSTFTSAGNLTLQYGIVAGTATYATVNSTGVGTFGITTSSGISMLRGTLALDPASRGIDATGTGIVASTGVFSSSVTAKQFFGIGASTIAVKAVNENLASNTTLQDDDELAIPIGANETYSVYGLLIASSTVATNDIKIGITVPAGAVMNIGWMGNNGTLTTANNGMLRSSGGSSPLISIGANIINPIFLSGTVVNGATAGFIKVQWAQFASIATNTTVTAGSYLGATRVE